MGAQLAKNLDNTHHRLNERYRLISTIISGILSEDTERKPRIVSRRRRTDPDTRP
jgi:hypothetical protein